MANEEFVTFEEGLEQEESLAGKEAVDTEAVNAEETEEYETFSVELNGITKDWAIIEEFKYTYKGEEKDYLICGEIVGDGISDAGLYIFQGKSAGEELEVKNVDTEEEYIAVAEAYCKQQEEAETGNSQPQEAAVTE